MYFSSAIWIVSRSKTFFFPPLTDVQTGNHNRSVCSGFSAQAESQMTKSLLLAMTKVNVVYVFRQLPAK